MAGPRWTFAIVAVRKWHRKGYYDDFYELRRSDGKTITTSADLAWVEAARRRFEAWAAQGWPYEPSR